MAENTNIEWCDATFNPWWGCQKVSPACDHCYAERDANRFAPGHVLWGVGSERRTFEDKPDGKNEHWDMPRKWNAATWFECLDCGNRYSSSSRANRRAEFATCGHCKSERAKIARRRVFCASMADWLDLHAPISEFVRLLDTIRTTPNLDWLLLSKRIGNWRKRLDEAMESIADKGPEFLGVAAFIELWRRGHAPANIWLGATVVNQEEADRDIPKLLAVPARVRFLSIEPMLGPISFDGMFANPEQINDGTNLLEELDWVICGGESGPHARPMHPDWARSLRDQCAAAGVPFLFKQWGEWLPEGQRATQAVAPDLHGRRWCTADDGDDRYTKTATAVHKVGKKASGRLLDGVTHDGFPRAS